MALTAAKSPLSMPKIGEVTENMVLYVPGDPGDTVTRNDKLTATTGEGIVDLLAADEDAVATAMQTVVVAAATVGFPYPGNFDPAHDASNTLVPVHPHVAAGTPIFLGTFASHYDDTVSSYDGSVPEIVLTTGCGSDDRPNGALVYVYDGAGIGQVNVVADYTHSGTHLVLHRKFEVAVDNTSSIIIVSGEAATYKGIGFFGHIDADNNNLIANNGADNGRFTVFLDWRDAARYLRNLTLPVIDSKHIWLS